MLWSDSGLEGLWSSCHWRYMEYGLLARPPSWLVYDTGEAVPQPSIEEKGITTMRLQRLHFSSSPCPQTLAINWPHSHRVSSGGGVSSNGAFVLVMLAMPLSQMKLRTIINISIGIRLSSGYTLSGGVPYGMSGVV